MGKCFDEDSCSQLIEAGIPRASAVFGGFIPTQLLEEAVYADKMVRRSPSMQRPSVRTKRPGAISGT